MQAIFLDDDEKVKTFIASISKPRLTKYLQSANGDERQALLLYHWNSQLSQALYLPLQSWEIVLRNKISSFFAYKYGSPKWHFDSRALRNFNRNDRRRLDETVQRLSRELGPAGFTVDQVVADLSAGFWVSQFGSDYAAQYGWTNSLKFRIFVNDHGVTRDVAEHISNDLLDLRNRVAHHEPIFHLPLDLLRKDLDRMLEGMCLTTAAYMSSACSFSAIWNARPGVQGLLGAPAPKQDEKEPEIPELANASGTGDGGGGEPSKPRLIGRLGLERSPSPADGG